MNQYLVMVSFVRSKLSPVARYEFLVSGDTKAQVKRRILSELSPCKVTKVLDSDKVPVESLRYATVYI